MNILYFDIPQEGYSLSFKKEDSNWAGLKELDILEWPAGEILLEKFGRNILARGRFKAVLFFDCSRCLEAFRFPVHVSFEQTLRPRDKDTLEGKDLELSASDLECYYFDDDTICCDRLIEEQLHLSLPMKPLCRKDCLGLCASCGSNQNTDPCQCAKIRKESPFDVLKDIIT